MKNKFDRLTKNEKKEALLDYKNSNDKNALVYKKFRKLETACLVGVVFGIGCTIFNTIYLTSNYFYEYMIDIMIILFSITSYFVSRKTFYKEVNNYLVNKK